MEIEHENLNTFSAEELYRRFLDGDGDAFEDLVTMYENELSCFIYGIVHDYHEAKHLVIETFARLVASGGQYAGKSSLKTYLFTIGKNLALRYAKMSKRDQHIPYEELIGVLSNEGDTPSHYLEREEDMHQLREAMRSLKEEHRTVLLLIYFEDMSYLQAGRAMNRSEKQIKHLAYRAKAALKKRLETEGFSMG